MSFEIRPREVEGIPIFDLHGRLVLGPPTAALQEGINGILAAGGNRLVLDFAAAPFMDSSGLGVLVAAHSAFEKVQGAVKLMCLSQRHLELLVLTKLNAIFEVFDDERAAIDSFFPGRTPRRFDILEFVRSIESEAPSLEPDEHASPAVPEPSE